MGIRKTPSVDLGFISATRVLSASRNSGKPWPVMLDNGMMGAASRKVPMRKFSISARAAWRRDSSTASAFVRATMPRVMPRSVRMSRCSLVWGITPSSAAITKMTASIPVAPATIVLTKFSWPGTSTMPTSRSLTKHGAKPSSMDIPRSFSALRWSVSQPVRSFTSAVLPWST